MLSIFQWEKEADRILNDAKPYLPIVARFCIVLYYLDASISRLQYWNVYMNHYTDYWKFHFAIAFVLMVYFVVFQTIACIAIMFRKLTKYGCIILTCVLIVNFIEIGTALHIQLISYKLSLLCGLLLLWIESWPKARALTSADLPSLGEDKPKNILQLVCRLLTLVMYLVVIDFGQGEIVYMVIGFPLVVQIGLGFKTKLAAFCLVLTLAAMNLFKYSFFLMEAGDEMLYYVKYRFFHTSSMIGSLLLLVDSGAGAMSLDGHSKKNW